MASFMEVATSNEPPKSKLLYIVIDYTGSSAISSNIFMQSR